MYDKVKLWIDRAMVGEQYPTLANNLDGARQETDLQTGEIKTFGHLEGLKVSVFVGGVSVVGSLAKYLYGNNVYPLGRHTTAQAVEKLSDALHIQADNINVTGLEFGDNFLMKRPVPEYLAKLGDIPRLERVQITPNSVRYEGTGKLHPQTFVFYDKIADATAKEMTYPEGLKGANMLRYEMRLNGRLSHQLRIQEVTASTLYQLPFYRMMVRRYQDTYFSVKKLNQVKVDVMSEIKTVTDAFNVFVARLINKTDPIQIGGFLDELKDAGVFDDRKNYTRLKNKIQEIATKANITVSDELMRELDDDIKNCGAYV